MNRPKTKTLPAGAAFGRTQRSAGLNLNATTLDAVLKQPAIYQKYSPEGRRAWDLGAVESGAGHVRVLARCPFTGAPGGFGRWALGSRHQTPDSKQIAYGL